MSCAAATPHDTSKIIECSAAVPLGPGRGSYKASNQSLSRPSTAPMHMPKIVVYRILRITYSLFQVKAEAVIWFSHICLASSISHDVCIFSSSQKLEGHIFKFIVQSIELCVSKSSRLLVLQYLSTISCILRSHGCFCFNPTCLVLVSWPTASTPVSQYAKVQMPSQHLISISDYKLDKFLNVAPEALVCLGQAFVASTSKAVRTVQVQKTGPLEYFDTSIRWAHVYADHNTRSTSLRANLMHCADLGKKAFFEAEAKMQKLQSVAKYIENDGVCFMSILIDSHS